MSRFWSDFLRRESRLLSLPLPPLGFAPLCLPLFEAVRSGALRLWEPPFPKKPRQKNPRRGRRGQVTVELILMMVVAAVLMQVSWNAIKEGGYLDKFASMPNKALSSMMANGNWITNETESKKHHPNRYGKRYSLQPER